MNSQVRLSKKDCDMLFFIWKWKIATTQMMTARFYGKGKSLNAHLRLWKLQRAGFLASEYSKDKQHHVWTLTSQGFEVIQSDLPPLSQAGYASENIKHDLLVAAVHLGLWVSADPLHVDLFTEQELRRIDTEFYPEWVPKSQIHRPDGYWNVTYGKQTRLLALEVELSQKHLEAYENVARFYMEDTCVNDVIWLIPRPQQARSIHTRIAKAIGDQVDLHNFISLADFLENHWQSQVFLGKHNKKTLGSLLNTDPKPSLNNGLGLEFFDTRKKPIESALKRNCQPLISVN